LGKGRRGPASGPYLTTAADAKNDTPLPSPTMPKATSEKLFRAHKPAPKKQESQASGSANTNPLFNTARFGQHILKNAQTAQKYVLNLSPHLELVKLSKF